MDISIFLAKLIGPLLLVIGAGLLINRTAYRDMAGEFLASRALIYFAGITTLLAGLAVVNTHNTWEGGWPTIITILGWLAVIGGIFRTLFPDKVREIGTTVLAKPEWLSISGAVTLVLGVLLSYFGYLA